MDKALWESATTKRAGRKLDWRRKMSDNVAYALLVYTGLQIFVTMGALKNGSGSILPYLALIVLVAAIIPGCRLFEKRWDGLSDGQAANPELRGRFRRDLTVLWLCAIGLPLGLTALFMGIEALGVSL
jgi:fatty acid desaturase